MSNKQKNTMKKATLLCSCLLLMAGKMAMAQETSSQRQWHHNAYVEIGPVFHSYHSPNLDHFRPMGGYGSQIYVGSRSSNWQASARYEFVTPNYHWAFRTGLQYTYRWKQIGYDALGDKITTLDEIPNHYLFEIGNDDTHLEYLRIRGIEQATHYLGIPLEIRYYFNSNLPSFRMYVMAEADLDYMVGNKNTVNFLNPDMAPYSDQILAFYDDPDPFNVSSYFGGGFQVGNRSGIGVGFNWMIHVYGFHETTGLINDLKAFAGHKMQIELFIPIK